MNFFIPWIVQIIDMIILADQFFSLLLKAINWISQDTVPKANITRIRNSIVWTSLWIESTESKRKQCSKHLTKFFFYLRLKALVSVRSLNLSRNKLILLMELRIHSILCREIRLLQKMMSWIWLKIAFSDEALVPKFWGVWNLFFIAITPWSTLTQSGSTY